MTRKEIPMDLQWIILDKAAEIEVNDQEMKPRGIAGFTQVCKAWQAILEPVLYHHFILDSSDLPDFDRALSPSKRKFVKHIWLRIRLPPSIQFGRCPRSEPPGVFSSNDYLFTNTVHNLWSILSKWEAENDNRNRGLTLELSAHAEEDLDWLSSANCYETDYNCYVKYLQDGILLPDGYRMDAPRYLNEFFDLPNETYRWLFAQMVEWGQRAVHVDKDLELVARQIENTPRLPSLPVVTKFLMRRQYKRGVNAETLGQIFKSLTHLQDINLERRQCYYDYIEKRWIGDAVAAVTFKTSLPDSLKRLSIYRDLQPIFQTELAARPIPSRLLSRDLVAASLKLEHLSISFLIDAEEFLDRFRPTRTYHEDNIHDLGPDWEHLETLALTSRVFRLESIDCLNHLLLAAARAAMKMPKLQIMELWGGQKGQGGIFRYQRIGHSTDITWLGTKPMQIQPRVMKAWGEVSRKHSQESLRNSEIHDHVAPGREVEDLYIQDLKVSAILLSPEEMVGVGSVVRHLKLRSHVIHPVSDHQGG